MDTLTIFEILAEHICVGDAVAGYARSNRAVLFPYAAWPHTIELERFARQCKTEELSTRVEHYLSSILSEIEFEPRLAPNERARFSPLARDVLVQGLMQA
jgi:hypothetical protein